jgi:ribonuclease P protein component
VKRLVREVFRRERALFPRGMELVVIAKTGAVVDSYEGVRAELRSAVPALSAALKRPHAQRARPGRDGPKEGG